MACLIPEFEDEATEIVEVPPDIRGVAGILEGKITNPSNKPTGTLVVCLTAGDGSRWFWLKNRDFTNTRALTWVRARRVAVASDSLMGPVLYVSKIEWEGVKEAFARSLTPPASSPTTPKPASSNVPIGRSTTGAPIDDLIASMPTPPARTPRKFMSKRDKDRFGV